jgi:hypothetical protein
VVLEVQPEAITLANPQLLWGQHKRWPVRRIRSVRLMPTAMPAGSLYVYTWLKSHTVFNGLEISELQAVLDRIHTITGTTIRTA